MNPSQILQYLKGNWKITREIIYNNIGKTIKAEGKAQFIPKENGLEYSEEIELDTNIQSSQQYLYKLEGSKLCKYFKDGRLFYELDDNGRAVHKCKNDLYEAEYSFSKNSFTLTYKISGPSKDYNITNIYKLLTKY